MPHPLFDLAVGLSRHEADRLRFSHRPIVAVPLDPLARAVEKVDAARADFEFALCEAFNAGDVDGLQKIVHQIVRCADGVLVLESMAKDLAGRMQR